MSISNNLVANKSCIYMVVGFTCLLLSCKKDPKENVVSTPTEQTQKDFIDSVSGDYTCSCNHYYFRISYDTTKTGNADTVSKEGNYPAHITLSRGSKPFLDYPTIWIKCDTPVYASNSVFLSGNHGLPINGGRYGAYSYANFSSDSVIYEYRYSHDWNPWNYGLTERITYYCRRNK